MHCKLSHLNQSIRSVEADYKYVEQKQQANVMLILKLKHSYFVIKPSLQNWIYGFGRYQYMVSDGSRDKHSGILKGIKKPKWEIKWHKRKALLGPEES